MVPDAVCTHVTSSALLRYNAVKLTIDSYQIRDARYNQLISFQSHIQFARKVQTRGDAFSKSSSIIALLTNLSIDANSVDP